MASTTPHKASPAHPGTHPPTPVQRAPVGSQDQPTIGALVHDLSEQIPALIRSELKLAQAEVTQKGKRLGIGIGMFSASGLVAFFALGTAITAAVLGLATAIPAWAAALVVTGGLLVIAAVLALVGRSSVDHAQPLTPEKAISGVQEDIETLKGIKP